MSNALFPDLPGLQWDVGKSPTFSTTVQVAASGKEWRSQNWPFPKYKFSLIYEMLRDGLPFQELRTLMGFFEARYGSFDSFLFADPDDSLASNVVVGAGDGARVSWQLYHPFKPYPVANVANVGIGPRMWAVDPSTPMWDPNGNTLMWSDAPSFTPDDYSISNGIITFHAPPAAGKLLLWGGTYYYRCRFMDDALDFSKFMQRLWELKKCQFMGSLGTLI